jgi:D-alanine transfer protein
MTPERAAQAENDGLVAGGLRQSTTVTASARSTKRVRVAVAARVLMVAIAVLTAGHLYARSLVSREVHAVAPEMFDLKNHGSAFQIAAFRQPDLLPIYGSSDLNVPNQYHASTFFRNYPTGFTVFPVGEVGCTCLSWLQALAAVGPDLRGKKVVFSLSAKWFMTDMVDAFSYAGHFSRLQANEFAFSSWLSFALKRRVARRMLQYPSTLEKEPLLTFALEKLADGSVASRALYYAVLPLGKFQNVIRRLQDDWEVMVFLHTQPGLTPVSRQAAPLDWPALLSQADQEQREHARDSPFGFENDFWQAHSQEVLRQQNSRTADGVRRTLERSAEWTDLTLLLQVTQELGAQPLLLSMPLNAAYYDFLGVPEPVRRFYYDKLAELARAHNVQLVDFSDHDRDPYFTIDSGFHPSRKGWIYYDDAINRFYNNSR